MGSVVLRKASKPYDDRATLECDCEGESLTGRKSIAANWELKLDSKLVSAFTLDDMILTGDEVRVDYLAGSYSLPVQSRG
jgi:hypothetical protein